MVSTLAAKYMHTCTGRHTDTHTHTHARTRTHTHTCLLDSDSSSIVNGIFVIIDGSIMPDKVKILLKVVQG